MPRLAYWDQEDHDKAMHLIRQPRELLLSLRFHVNGVPLAKKHVRVYVARSMVEGCDEFQEYLLDSEGQLELIQPYTESLIDVQLDKKALPLDSGIDELNYHWFYPGKWFEKLTIHRDLTSWAVDSPLFENGDVTYSVHFDSTLQLISAQMNFSNLLGHIFEAPKMGNYPEATAKIIGKGKLVVTYHLRAFFEKWAQNYTTPFQVGDEYPIELIFTLDTTFDVKPSTKQDPAFVPKTYDGRVDHTDGNPYLGVPSTTPEHTVQLVVKRTITLTSEMLPSS